MFDLIKRALVRYFRRPATSVPPKSGHAAAMALIKSVRNAEPPTFPGRDEGEAEVERLLGMTKGTMARERQIASEHIKHNLIDHIITREQAKPVIMDGPEGWRDRPLPDAVLDVQARLNALDIPEGATPEEIEELVQETIGHIPGVRLGGVVHVDDPRYPEIAAQHEAMLEVQNLQGADMPAREAVPETMTWPVWAKWMAAVKAPPGWSACRFGARVGNDQVGQMFGITRGDFGVYAKPFYVCHPVHAERVLAPLIHLPTGTGVAMFMTTEQAVEAAELAMALGGIEWRTSIDPMNPDSWAGIRERMAQAWQAAGLRVAPFHCHDGLDDQTEIAVWMSSHHTRTAGKPAKGKLS